MKTEGDKMLFVIDVGNTNIVFGIYEKDELLHNWRVATDKNRTADEYAMLFEQLLSFNKLSSDDIEDVIISSVVPNLINILPNMFKKYYNIDPVVIGPGVKTGMNIKYDNPKEVGADRIVNGPPYISYPAIRISANTSTNRPLFPKDIASNTTAIIPKAVSVRSFILKPSKSTIFIYKVMHETLIHFT